MEASWEGFGRLHALVKASCPDFRGLGGVPRAPRATQEAVPRGSSGQHPPNNAPSGRQKTAPGAGSRHFGVSPPNALGPGIPFICRYICPFTLTFTFLFTIINRKNTSRVNPYESIKHDAALGGGPVGLAHGRKVCGAFKVAFKI